jgi:hypothetical protein
MENLMPKKWEQNYSISLNLNMCPHVGSRRTIMKQEMWTRGCDTLFKTVDVTHCSKFKCQNDLTYTWDKMEDPTASQNADS